MDDIIFSEKARPRKILSSIVIVMAENVQPKRCRTAHASKERSRRERRR
jgi:hypothetical protein